MPDLHGKLSDDEKDKVVSWLKEKWKGPVICPYSKDSEWIIGEYIVAPINYSKKGIFVGGEDSPQVMVVCKNCGHTVFLNAVILGLFPPGGEVSDARK